nr:MAG TPA: hypothetical protein [Caudoviricetes sp.]
MSRYGVFYRQKSPDPYEPRHKLIKNKYYFYMLYNN